MFASANRPAEFHFIAIVMANCTKSFRRIVLRATLRFCSIAWIGLLACSFATANDTFRVELGKKSHTGKILARDDSLLILLRRDGQIVEINRKRIVSMRKVSSTFKPYTSLKMQTHLKKIFNDQYEVSRTAHYVVVHPKGKRSQWADPFEKLYNRFTHYFRVNGFELRSPRFPMVVVVFNTQGEFTSLARNVGINDPNQIAGYYSQLSNRIMTFQIPGNSNGVLNANRATLIHEALHQFAFNTGIHRRLGQTPRWTSEGLASMFENPGVHNSRRYTSSKARQHKHYLPHLKQMVDNGSIDGKIGRLLQNNRLFERDMSTAYAVSWGLAHYLAETRASSFNRYLQKVSQRKSFVYYSPSDRVRDFKEAFASDLILFESQFKKFITSK